MMSLGYAGNGGSSVPSSNLSPLAPPFTVDRSNPKPNSNPLSTFTEPSPYPIPNWSYNHSSSSRPDFVVDSIRTSSIPSENEYSYIGPKPANPQNTRWSAALNPSPDLGITESFSYLSDAKPFYPPYESPVGNDDNPLVALNEPSYDLLSTSGFVPVVDGPSQVDYAQTLSGLEYAPQWEGIWSGGLAETNRGKRMEADDSFFSEEADIAGSLVYTNYMKQAESLNKGKEDSALSSGNYVDLIGREIRIGPSVTGKLDGKSLSTKNQGLIPVDFSEAPNMRTFPIFPESGLQGPTAEPLKEPWNNQKPYTVYDKRFQMFDAGMTDFISATKSSPIVIKPPSISTTVLGPDKASSKNEVNSQAVMSDQHTFLALSSKKEEGSKLYNFPSKNDLGHASKDRSGFQLPDINIADVESIETVKSEDSPCWRGAGPASHFSPFEILDDVTPQHLMKKLQTSNGVNLLGTSMNSFDHGAQELCETTIPDENVGVVSGFSLSPKKTTAAKPTCSKEHGPLCDSDCKSDSKTSRIQLPSVEEALSIGSVIHAVGSVESNLFSGQEDSAKPASAATVNVQVLVKSMYDLSALLLLHCSNDMNALKENDHLALDNVISNLDACLSRKIVQVSSTRDSLLPQLGTPNEGASAGKSHSTIEAHVSSNGQVNSHFAPYEKNCDLTGKKIEKTKSIVSLTDDADISKDHKMIQAIKKVLDENLESEEEFQSETLLYKNLWLEAEAELCAISYRARFERMKREMEKLKSKVAKDVSENTVALKKPSSSRVSHDPTTTLKLIPEVNVDSIPIPNTPVQESVVSCSNSHVNDVEASVMARFNILKRRGEPVIEQGQPETKSFDVAVGPPRLRQQTFEGNDDNILKRGGEPMVEQEGQPETKSFDVAVGPRLRQQNFKGNDDNISIYTGDSDHEAVREFPACVTDHQAVMESRGTNRMQNQVGSGWYNSPYSSSDWEHVLRDEVAWQN